MLYYAEKVKLNSPFCYQNFVNFTQQFVKSYIHLKEMFKLVIKLCVPSQKCIKV